MNDSPGKTKNKPKTIKELRQFALVIGIAASVFGVLLKYQGKDLADPLLWLSAIVLLLGLVVPRALVPFEWAWMKFAHCLGVVMSYVIVTIIFYGAVTPMSFLLKLLGKDLLGRKIDKSRDTYWEKVEDDGPSTRPYLPY